MKGLAMLLTDENGEKFYLNIDLIERIQPRKFRGGCEIFLTSDHVVECIEDFKTVVTDLEMKKALSK